MMTTNKINYSELASIARKQGVTHHAVCAIILRDEKVLLIKRANTDHRGGEWEIPGGKVEKGEGLKAALAREMREETNLKLSEVKKYVGHSDYKAPKFIFRLFMFDAIADDSEVSLNPAEHTQFLWASLAEARKLLNHDDFTSLFLSYMDSR